MFVIGVKVKDNTWIMAMSEPFGSAMLWILLAICLAIVGLLAWVLLWLAGFVKCEENTPEKVSKEWLARNFKENE